MTTLIVKGLDLVDGMIEPDFEEDLGQVTVRNISQKMMGVIQVIKVAINTYQNLQIIVEVQIEKPGIARIVMGMIHDNKLDKHKGEKIIRNDYKKVFLTIKEHHPAARFRLSHYFWYLSRFRRQKEFDIRTVLDKAVK